MTKGVASGTFEVAMKPVAGADGDIASMSLAKNFHGDLTASSVGQMLAFRTQQEGSAGYVAIERVTGALAGRQGAFVLQHSGTMNRGALAADIAVIPDSATEALTGLTGTMQIKVVDGQHHYTLHYALPN